MTIAELIDLLKQKDPKLEVAVVNEDCEWATPISGTSETSADGFLILGIAPWVIEVQIKEVQIKGDDE